MGMGGSVPSVSTPPPIPATQSPQGIKAGQDAAARAQAAVGPSATIQTGANGVTTPASTGTKSLLGS